MKDLLFYYILGGIALAVGWINLSGDPSPWWLVAAYWLILAWQKMSEAISKCKGDKKDADN